MNRARQPTRPAARPVGASTTRPGAAGGRFGRNQSPPKKGGGAKARRELQTEEANIRSEAMIAYQQEFERITELCTAELGTVKERLIHRLERNLNETTVRCQETVRECKQQVRSLLSGIATFHTDLSKSTGLESSIDVDKLTDDRRPLEVITAELKQLSKEVAALIKKGTEKVDTAEKRIYQLEEALAAKSAEAASVERLLQDSLVRGTSDFTSAIEKTRDFGLEIRQRMNDIEGNLKKAIDELIEDSAVACYDANAYPKHVGIATRDATVSSFFSKAEEGRIEQASLLRDVRKKIVELTKQKLVQLDEMGKNSISNLPDLYQEYISSPSHFSREDLVHLINFVSYEPRVSEAIIAVLDEYQELVEADDGEQAKLMDVITRVASQDAWKKGDKPTQHDPRVQSIQSNLILTPSKQHDPPIEPLLMASPAAKHIRSVQSEKKKHESEQFSYAMYRSKEPGFKFPSTAPSSPATNPRSVSLKAASPASVLYSQKQRELLARLQEE